MKRIIYLSLLLFLISCGEDKIADRGQADWLDIQEALQEAMLLAESGDTIRIPEGYYLFDKSILMDNKDSVCIIGAGMDKTILSFLGQTEGAEGIKISNCNSIQLLDFTIEDASGDNIKVTDTKGILFRNVKAQWTGAVSEKNGAYAFYPVLCQNVVIEECVAIGASDAGIYVGQSDTVIIRNNVASQNVAGIESENSNYVKIYQNKAINNTGGILVFDLPGLTQYGSDIEVYQNEVISNNHENFAPEGNIVGVVPPGTGIMVLATKHVSIYENKIHDNRTVGAAVISYELVAAISQEEDDQSSDSEEGTAEKVNNNYELDENYDPYPQGIRIEKNDFENKHWFATFAHDFGLLFNFKFPFNPPDVVFDGFIRSGLSEKQVLCVSEQPSIRFANLDAPNNLDNVNENIDLFLCKN